MTTHVQREAAPGAASETAVAWLVCRVDLAQVLKGAGHERERALRRIGRAMERERWKGRTAYDLDRHLALKRCRDRLLAARNEAAPPMRRRRQAERLAPA